MKMMEKKKNWLVMIATCLIALLFEVTMSGYELGRGDNSIRYKVPIEDLEVYGYERTGETLQTNQADSTIVFPCAQNIGSIEITFCDPLSTDIPVELYYLQKRDIGFDRFSRIERYMFRGTEKARIRVPIGKWEQLRLDMHGDFGIQYLEVLPSNEVNNITMEEIVNQINPWRLLIAIVICVGGAYSFADRVLFGRNEDNSKLRNVELDGLRTLAAVFVVVVHVIEPLGLIVPFRSILYYGIEGISIICLSSNLLFVMISGALLLSWKDETAIEFAEKRILSVLIPFLVYSLFYLRAMCVSIATPMQWLTYMIPTYINGEFIKGQHLWLIYKLIGLYCVTIPLRYMVKNIPENIEKFLVVLIVIFQSLNTVLEYGDFQKQIEVFLSGWTGIYLMGYFITKQWMRKYDKLIIISGIFAIVFSVYLSGHRNDFKDVIANTSIIMLCIASLFVVILIRGKYYLERCSRILAKFSQYSYSVLLIHMYVLGNFVYNGILSSEMSRMIQVVAPIILCILFSFGMAFLVDKCVIVAFTYHLKMLIRRYLGDKIKR